MLQNGEDNTDFTYYTEDEQKKFFETDLPAAGEAFAESIAEYCIANGYVEEGLSDVANGMVNWGFGEANEDGSITGASGEVYTDPTYADYWFELETYSHSLTIAIR
jgi:peptide/nickel transport system substrate-binding protein